MIKPEDMKSDFGKKLFNQYLGIYAGRIDESAEETVLESVEDKPVKIEKIEKHVVSLADIIPQSSNSYAKGDSIFSELLDYFHSGTVNGSKITPLLEEDGNALLATVAVTSGLSTIIEGKSRSGKTLLADKVCDLLPSMYSFNSGSDKAIVDIASKINQSRVLYVAEFQEALHGNPTLKEAFKHISENKDWIYNKSKSKTVLSGKTTILSTSASENKQTMNRDVELSGRFIILNMRSDAEKIKKICDYQDQVIAGELKEEAFSDSRYEFLKNHIKAVVNDDTTNFENPFSINFGQDYLPRTQKSIHYRTLYFSLINAFTNFDSPNRIRKGNSLITSIADVYLAHSLYHETYCATLNRLATQSFKSLEKTLVESDLVLERDLFEQELALLNNHKTVDWQTLWNDAYDVMKRNNPRLVYEWVESQSKNGLVIVYDPIKKEEVSLCEVQPVAGYNSVSDLLTLNVIGGPND